MQNASFNPHGRRIVLTQDCDAGLSSAIKAAQENVEKAVSAVNEYIQAEKQRNEELSKKINSCGAFFEKLEDSAARVLMTTELMHENLSSSRAALGIADNLGEQLKDINAGFAASRNEQAAEVYRQLQRILDRLTGVAHQCAHFQSFPKPYKDIIDLYNVKIESVFGVLPQADAEKETQTAMADSAEFPNPDAQTPDNQAWNHHYRTGAGCAFIMPERAIVELTEAIRLNPEYARQYYFRGIAYRRKKEPNLYAALKDFEKALFLSPKTDEYISAVEDVKSEIDAKNAEVIQSWSN
jgi:tetratricopeptide (TPR) repeat protein